MTSTCFCLLFLPESGTDRVTGQVLGPQSAKKEWVDNLTTCRFPAAVAEGGGVVVKPSLQELEDGFKKCLVGSGGYAAS